MAKIGTKDGYYTMEKYGDMVTQANVHYGKVFMDFPDVSLLSHILETMSSGLTGSGNYILFQEDVVVLVTDSKQYGFRYFVRLNTENYEFLEGVEDVSQFCVILRTEFAAIKQLLNKAKPKDPNIKNIEITKQANDTILDFYAPTGDQQTTQINCYAMTAMVPEPHLDSSMVFEFSTDIVFRVCNNMGSTNSDQVHIYVARDRATCHFYAYAPVDQTKTEGTIGDSIREDEFEPELGNVSLKCKSNFTHFRTHKRAIRAVAKIAQRAKSFHSTTMHLFLELGDSPCLCFSAQYTPESMLEQDEKIYIYAQK